MHAQIKQVIGSLAVRGNKVMVRLTAGESTPLGKIIGRLYYQSQVMDLLSNDERFGYPHNGGSHSLELICKPLDAIEFIETMKEEAETRKFAFNFDESQVVAELSYISQEIYTLRRSM
jgi:hypothetical protein